MASAAAMLHGTDHDDSQEVDHAQPHGADAPGRPTVLGTVYVTRTGERVVVPQHVHYALRGLGLAALSLYEWTALVSVACKRDGNNKDDDNDECGAEAQQQGENAAAGPGRGRIGNGTFEFDPRHPLHETHFQRLRSKLCVPQLNCKPPRCEKRDRKRAAQLTEAAAFYLTLMRPWDADTRATGDTTTPDQPRSATAAGAAFNWVAFAGFMKQAQRSAIGRARVDIITNMAHGLSAPSSEHN